MEDNQSTPDKFLRIFVFSLAVLILLVGITFYTPIDPNAKETKLVVTETSFQEKSNLEKYSSLSDNSQSKVRVALAKLSETGETQGVVTNPTKELQNTSYVTLDNTVYALEVNKEDTLFASAFSIVFIVFGLMTVFSGLMLGLIGTYRLSVKLNSILNNRLSENTKNLIYRLIESKSLYILLLVFTFLLATLTFVQFGHITTAEKVDGSEVKATETVPVTELTETQKDTFYTLIPNKEKVWLSLEEYSYIKSDGEIYEIKHRDLSTVSSWESSTRLLIEMVSVLALIYYLVSFLILQFVVRRIVKPS